MDKDKYRNISEAAHLVFYYKDYIEKLQNPDVVITGANKDDIIKEMNNHIIMAKGRLKGAIASLDEPVAAEWYEIDKKGENENGESEI